MKIRAILTACLMVVSLGSSAQVHRPDSLLSVNKAYTYFFTSPDTAQAILQTVRERKLEAESLIDYAEGDLNFNMRQCLKALPYFEKVKNNPAVRDSNFVQMLVLKRMMECYDAIYDEDNMIETTLQLRKSLDRKSVV